MITIGASTHENLSKSYFPLQYIRVLGFLTGSYCVPMNYLSAAGLAHWAMLEIRIYTLSILKGLLNIILNRF